MKSIKTKLKIDITTYLFVLLYFLCGYIKNIIIIYIIIIFHEFGHVLASKILKYKITSVTIYPFGGITKSDQLINAPLNSDLIIYWAGLIFQIILFVPFMLFYKLGIINLNTLKLFVYFNICIFLFNALPIAPLDGYLILNNILNRFTSFYNAKIITYIFSTIFIVFFIYFYHSNYIIWVFLIVNQLKEIINFKYVFNKFLLERHLYKFSWRRKKYYKEMNLKKLEREKLGHYYNGFTWLSEKDLLSKMFDKKGYFWYYVYRLKGFPEKPHWIG